MFVVKFEISAPESPEDSLRLQLPLRAATIQDIARPLQPVAVENWRNG